MKISSNVNGILFLLLAMLIISLQSIAVKWLGGSAVGRSGGDPLLRADDDHHPVGVYPGRKSRASPLAGADHWVSGRFVDCQTRFGKL